MGARMDGSCIAGVFISALFGISGHLSLLFDAGLSCHEKIQRLGESTVSGGAEFIPDVFYLVHDHWFRILWRNMVRLFW